MMNTPLEAQPLSRVEWLDAKKLKANDYNPNMVMTPELRLLEYNLLRLGWVQPILIDEQRNIIDGFHRWRLSLDSARLQAKYCGFVPTVTLKLTRAEAMMLTVRMNRAKGVAAAVRMSELVRELLDKHGLDRQEVALGIGATLDEVELLYQESIFKARKLEDYVYSRAWYPHETGKVLKKARRPR